MKKILSLVLLMTASTSFAQINFSDSVDIDPSHTSIRLQDVSYRVIPSKTEVRSIPGCRIGNSSRECTEVVVLEKQAVVQVSVSYMDGIFHDTDPRVRKQYLTFNFRPETFTAEQVAELKEISKWDLSGNYLAKRLDWAHSAIELKTSSVTRNVQEIDLRNSRLCPIDRGGYSSSRCVEVLAYKPGVRNFTEVKIVVK